VLFFPRRGAAELSERETDAGAARDHSSTAAKTEIIKATAQPIPLINPQNSSIEKITMKKITLVLLLALARGLLAQDCNTCKGSNNLSLTTGLDTSGVLIPMPTTATGGVVDPYWQLVNVAPPSANGSGGIAIPNAYTVQFGASVGIPTWLNQPGADALSVIPNYQFSTNNSVANQPWRFVRKFYLCQNSSVHFCGWSHG
jgi:hypothetical protein